MTSLRCIVRHLIYAFISTHKHIVVVAINLCKYNTYAKITSHNNGFSKIARANVCVPTMGGLRANGIRTYDGGITGEWYSLLQATWRPSRQSPYNDVRGAIQ